MGTKEPPYIGDLIGTMAANTFLEFKQFPSKNLAMETAEALNQEGILTELGDTIHSANLVLMSHGNMAQFAYSL